MTTGTAEVVIATKLFRPSLRQQSVERKRLHDVLRQGCTLPLTLVVAPAGWGKSTIVADWLARDAVTAGWVSLDGGDNDPKRFWRYLLLAADQAGSAAGASALRRLDAAGSDMLRDVLPTFVNELALAETPLVLVLDDYHLVTSAGVHATVATLLDRCPPQLHLMLITRADPPLPLSRLRVRGDMAELRAEDLRFSAGETVEFCSSRLGPLLSEHDVLRLLARTEEWAAGLQLAALRLRDRADPADFIDRLTGADWHIVNYLGEEVLASQSPEVREFLLVTSVLNRMCASLCDALTGQNDGAGLISEIYRANLFLVPLDDEHRWFRYHHLFGGLLRHELARTTPDRPSVLHRRAARWFADHGDAAEAIGHAIASGDETLSGRLVAARWRQPFNAGQLETVRMWLDALPAELIATDASLSAARVWVALDTGRLEEVGAATQAHGLHTPGGRVTTTGLGGFTTGGGYGWTSSKFGLACDNLISAEVVLADGSVVRASEREHADLFWGIRGGGGNFGIVTEFEFRLHPLGPIVLAGLAMFPIDRAPDVLRRWPDELSTGCAVILAPPEEFVPPELRGHPVLGIPVLYIGDSEAGAAVVQPLKNLGPAVDHIGPMPYTAFQAALDPLAPWDISGGFYARGEYMPDLSDAAIEVFLAHAADLVTLSPPFSQMIIFRIGQGVAAVPDQATAFSHRDASYLFHPISAWLDPADGEKMIAATRAFAADMQPFSTGASYLNFTHEAGRVRDAYGDAKYARLVALKDTYDPANLFRLNQNIRPSQASAEPVIA